MQVYTDLQRLPPLLYLDFSLHLGVPNLGTAEYELGGKLHVLESEADIPTMMEGFDLSDSNQIDVFEPMGDHYMIAAQIFSDAGGDGYLIPHRLITPELAELQQNSFYS